MGRVSVLAGVAHDIAHHTASGLSYISPHLALALREAGLQTTVIEILAAEPYPDRVAELRPLRLALSTLRSTTLEILRKHKFETADVSSVVLHATPALGTFRATLYIPESLLQRAPGGHSIRAGYAGIERLLRVDSRHMFGS